MMHGETKIKKSGLYRQCIERNELSCLSVSAADIQQNLKIQDNNQL